MADKKKHFYVVLKGRKPGIYTQWSVSGGAEEQIKGYPGAVFRGLPPVRRRSITSAPAAK